MGSLFRRLPRPWAVQRLSRLPLVTIATSVVCLVVLVVGPEAARASFAGTNGRIAFTTLSDLEIDHVFTVNPDGSGLTDLSDYWLEDMQPAFSPDGVWIAFTSDRDGNQEIYVMATDGTHVTRVTDDPARDFDPAFSADGSRIAFVSDRDGHEQIYSVRRDGTDLTRVMTSQADDEDPAFSADGSRLAFSSDRDGNRQIYVAGADGADPLRLTSDAAADHQPSFSPDGSRIAFTSQRAGGVAHIYVMDARGSTPVLLTSSDTSADHNPSFSPDGTKIAFAGDFVCPPDQGCGAILAGGIYVIPSDGSGGRTLVTAYAPLADTDWGVGTPAVPPPPPPEPADTTPPDTSITSGPSGATNNPTATFAFVATDDITPGEQLQYSYRLDGDAWSSYSTATTATLTLADSAHTFAVRARDEAGNQDPTPAQRSFTVDTAAPAGSLAIQGGAARTRTLNVTLTLGASDPAPSSSVNARRISNTSGGLADAAWRPYAATEEWTLSSGRGTKTVYAQYRDAAGNVSPAARDTITYKP